MDVRLFYADATVELKGLFWKTISSEGYLKTVAVFGEINLVIFSVPMEPEPPA